VTRLGILAFVLLSACSEEPPPADRCGGLPLDADGDGVCDGADPCPLDADNDEDADGVCAADDPCPLDADDDSDGDGVCDSDDTCPDGDDAVDSDDDGVADDCDACPLDPAITEGEGPCAGEELPCSYVDVALAPLQPSVGAFTPDFLGVTWGGIVNGSGFEDFVVDGAPESAWLEFSFYDADLAWQCSVRYDLSRPGAAMPSTSPWVQAAPVTLFEAWDLFPGQGQTDCGELAHDAFPGVLDPRDMIESIEWAVGLGPMHSLDEHMQADPAYQADWATLYEPHALSVYVSYEGNAPVEAGYALGYARTCDTLDLDPVSAERVLAPRPDAGPLADAYEGHVYYLLPL